MTTKRRRALVLLAILAALAVYKMTFTRYTFETHPDGGYYTNIAAHVRDGRGLVTNLCLLHKGCLEFPAPADIYPLWPLIYGHVARFFPLLDTGKWLATLFYFASLLFGYLWATSVFPKPLLPDVLPSFDAGHLFVLMLGLNKEYFTYTTYPYCEALAFTVVLAALWRGGTLWKHPSWRSGIELGLWLALAFLARKQMFVLTLAAAPLLLGGMLVFAEQRKQYASMALAAGATFCALVTPHYLHLKKVVPGLTLTQVLRWDQTRFSDVLTPVPILREVDGIWPYLKDRWQGFGVAFDPKGKLSYADHFYTFHYGLLVALALLVWLGLRHGGKARAIWVWARRRENLGTIWALVFALGAFLSLHTMHMHPVAASEWVFGGRWGVPCVFLFFAALVLLFRQSAGVWRAAATLIVCSGIYLGAIAVRDTAKRVDGRRPSPPSALARWLNHQQAARGSLVVAHRRPQGLSIDTPDVNYHWYHNRTSLHDIQLMVSRLGADYLLVPGERFTFMRDAKAFQASFQLVEKIGNTRIYAPTDALLARRSSP